MILVSKGKNRLIVQKSKKKIGLFSDLKTVDAENESPYNEFTKTCSERVRDRW